LRDPAETGSGSRKPVEFDQSRAGRLSRMGALQDRRWLWRRPVAGKSSLVLDHRLTCGAEIAAKRLERDPATPVCADCAR
jgi:hypothetical protein